MTAKLLKFIGFASVLVLTGCAAGNPPPRASGGSSRASVDASLAAQASAFEAYTRRAARIDATFANPAEISSGLRTAAGYDPRQLEAGMIAYAAMAAMQEPKFVAVVRSGGRDLGRRLAADPDAAVNLPGGPAAAARANAALARRGAALSSAGQQVRKAAYSVQKQPWSRTRISNGPQLSLAKQAASYRAESGDRASLGAALSEGGRSGGASPVVNRALTVAALTVLGQNAQARSLMNEPRSGQCLRSAKLNFHQCLAAAGTHYENIYCLGLHAMADPGQCVVEATKPVRVRRAAL